MAKFDVLIPYVLGWESGVILQPGESNEQLFNRAKAKGIAFDKNDAGGHTICGVTYTTYKAFRLSKKFNVPTIADLGRITYKEWLEILKNKFWDKWKADDIKDQSVANTLVDWTWMSGANGIKIPQRLLGVVADGVVGPKTIAAVNSKDGKALFNQIQEAKKKYFNDICISRPQNKKFLNGWLNRANSCKYGSLICCGNKEVKF